jgi:hypothetical protein
VFKKGYPDADLTVEKSIITRWYDDPFSLGSYSFRGPNVNVTVESGIDDPLLSAHGNIRFGGEYMA